MVDTGYISQVGNIVSKGEPSVMLERNVGAAAGMYPGYLAMRQATEHDIILADGTLPPLGIIGFEQTAINFKKELKTTIYVVEDKITILRGSGFSAELWLHPGLEARQGDLLCSWEDGVVCPYEIIDGKMAIRIPFTKNTSEEETAVDIPSGAIVRDVFIRVVTNDGSGTLSIGIESSEGGGDADGFVITETLTAVGGIRPGPTIVDGSSEHYVSATTRGALLVDLFEAGSDAVEDVGTYFEKIHKGDGTAESISYTTSAHTVAGDFFLAIESPGIQHIGRAGADVDNSSGSDPVAIHVDVSIE